MTNLLDTDGNKSSDNNRDEVAYLTPFAVQDLQDGHALYIAAIREINNHKEIHQKKISGPVIGAIEEIERFIRNNNGYNFYFTVNAFTRAARARQGPYALQNRVLLDIQTAGYDARENAASEQQYQKSKDAGLYLHDIFHHHQVTHDLVPSGNGSQMAVELPTTMRNELGPSKIIAWAEKQTETLGVTFDATKDAARLRRMPGTINIKGGRLAEFVGFWVYPNGPSPDFIEEVEAVWRAGGTSHPPSTESIGGDEVRRRPHFGPRRTLPYQVRPELTEQDLYHKTPEECLRAIFRGERLLFGDGDWKYPRAFTQKEMDLGASNGVIHQIIRRTQPRYNQQETQDHIDELRISPLNPYSCGKLCLHFPTKVLQYCPTCILYKGQRGSLVFMVSPIRAVEVNPGIDPRTIAARQVMNSEGNIIKVLKNPRAGGTYNIFQEGTQHGITIISHFTPTLSQVTDWPQGQDALEAFGYHKCPRWQKEIEEHPALKQIQILPTKGCWKCPLKWAGKCDLWRIIHNNIDIPTPILLTYSKLDGLLLADGIRGMAATEVLNKINSRRTLLCDEFHGPFWNMGWGLEIRRERLQNEAWVTLYEYTTLLPELINGIRSVRFYGSQKPEGQSVTGPTILPNMVDDFRLLVQQYQPFINNEIEQAGEEYYKKPMAFRRQNAFSNNYLNDDISNKLISGAVNELIRLIKEPRSCPNEFNPTQIEPIIYIISSPNVTISIHHEGNKGEYRVTQLLVPPTVQWNLISRFLSGFQGKIILNSATPPSFKIPFLPSNIILKEVNFGHFGEPLPISDRLLVIADTFRLGQKNWYQYEPAIIRFSKMLITVEGPGDVFFIAQSKEKSIWFKDKVPNALVDYAGSNKGEGIPLHVKVIVFLGAPEVPANALDALALELNSEREDYHSLSQALHSEKVHTTIRQWSGRHIDPEGQNRKIVICLGVRPKQVLQSFTWGKGRKVQISEITNEIEVTIEEVLAQPWGIVLPILREQEKAMALIESWLHGQLNLDGKQIGDAIERPHPHNIPKVPTAEKLGATK